MGVICSPLSSEGCGAYERLNTGLALRYHKNLPISSICSRILHQLRQSFITDFVMSVLYAGGFFQTMLRVTCWWSESISNSSCHHSLFKFGSGHVLSKVPTEGGSVLVGNEATSEKHETTA